MTPRRRHRTQPYSSRVLVHSESVRAADDNLPMLVTEYRELVPKRLVLFSPGHTEPGGAAVRSQTLARVLADGGWDVRAVTRAGSLSRFRLERSSNLTILEVPGFARRRLGGALFLLVALPTGIVWGMRSAAFLAISLSSPGTAAALCGLVSRRPYLAFTTSSGERSELRYVLSTHSSGFRQWLLRRATFLVAQTPFSAAELEVVVPPERIAVLPNPVRIVVPKPLDGRRRAVYTGRLSAEKDLFRLLEAWKTIAKDQRDARLTLVGAGGTHRSVERELRAAVERDPLLHATVTFTGWVTDVGEYLRQADVYVFPSLEEGMSNALLEACARGRVIVASDIPANRAVLGNEYPLLFRAGDTAAMTAALRRAFEDRQLQAEAVQRVAANAHEFSHEAFAARLEELIMRALNRPKPPVQQLDNWGKGGNRWLRF
jgi:glycosyltransferase involved in cell wall biosynthesis